MQRACVTPLCYNVHMSFFDIFRSKRKEEQEAAGDISAAYAGSAGDGNEPEAEPMPEQSAPDPMDFGGGDGGDGGGGGDGA
jgi:hypothetical protein